MQSYNRTKKQEDDHLAKVVEILMRLELDPVFPWNVSTLDDVVRVGSEFYASWQNLTVHREGYKTTRKSIMEIKRELYEKQVELYAAYIKQRRTCRLGKSLGPSRRGLTGQSWKARRIWRRKKHGAITKIKMESSMMKTGKSLTMLYWSQMKVLIH
jgi:hypothetical protein